MCRILSFFSILTLMLALAIGSYASAADAQKDANLPALRLAIEDLTATFGEKYKDGAKYLQELEALEKQATASKPDWTKIAEAAQKLRSKALLANPLLDFDKLLLVKRSAKSPKLGLPQNWQGNCALKKDGYDNEIAVLSPVTPDGKITTLYRPEGKESGSRFVGDVDLHFDAEKMLFSMPNDKGKWQIFEIGTDGKNLRQVTKGEIADNANNYDACYLPSEKIIFGSTACHHGVPCVGGGNTVANLFQMTADGEKVRQLCFDQDHNWCPVVLGNGRVLYTRWEYSDTAHYFTRLLMQMNPDGTNQMSFYGSNSLWPNSFFYARPIPGHPTKVISVISGHHGVARMGELVIFDTALGRHEAQGALQRIPGYGKKVKPIYADGLVNGSWPKFLHPYPLSEKYFITSMKPNSSANWGIYLVDKFDNFVKIKELPDYVLFEPVPLKKTKRPPIVPERARPGAPFAVAIMSDVHFGPGLRGVPRGTIKKLRLYEPHFGYPGMGGHINIGIDGPWDVHKILGEVPVDPDGSANFAVPPATPVAIQPLDKEGRAVAVMRSWFVAQPGETIACIGCHESGNETPPAMLSTAMRRAPTPIAPWNGPARGFSFTREVQPVLDKYCVGCHDGSKKDRPDLRVDGTTPKFRNFTPSYVALHPYVRRPGPESDYHLQFPMEWHASTSELIQMLEKGHHNVKLDADAWSRLVTWIDLNVPDKGTWAEHRNIRGGEKEARAKMRKLYAGVTEDPEVIIPTDEKKIEFVKPEKMEKKKAFAGTVKNWPFTPEQAAKMIKETATEDLPAEMTIAFKEGEGDDAKEFTMDFVLIPAGEFVMGSVKETMGEYPQSAVKIAKPFYIAKGEVLNKQFQVYDPQFDPGVISYYNKDQGNRGYYIDRPGQPTARVTWQQATAFCKWLSEKTGKKVNLPTEAEWEWAARAGSDKAFYFGDIDADFSQFANLADKSLEKYSRRDSPKWHLRIDKFNDGSTYVNTGCQKKPNAFGVCDIIGNLSEWTRSDYVPYPYNAAAANSGKPEVRKVVRGGSWNDRPYRATSSYRIPFETWQHIYNVGFRPIIEVE